MLTAKQFIRTHYGSVAEFVRVMNENGIKVTSHAPERWGAIGMPEKYWGPIIAAGHSKVPEPVAMILVAIFAWHYSHLADRGRIICALLSAP